MEEIRFQLFLFFLNYWRLYKNMGVDMGDVWRAIQESIPDDLPVCALEGCDTVLLGYSSKAFFCSDACRWRDRDQTPERIAYYQSPERKAANKYWKAVRRAVLASQ